MRILKDGEFVKIESSDKFERTEKGQIVVDQVMEVMNPARLWKETCIIAMGEEQTKVKVKGCASMDLCKGEMFRAEVVKSDKYDEGQVVCFRLKDIIDVPSYHPICTTCGNLISTPVSENVCYRAPFHGV